MHSDGKTIIELPDSTSGVPLVLGYSVKICPGGNLTVPLECTRPITDRMDIRMDVGFHHRNPNVYIHPISVNNPNNKYNLKYMPLTIFNLSKVDHLYIGKDTVITFVDAPEFETYNVEIASEDTIKEHLAKPRHWVPQKHKTLPEIPSDTAFICLPADVPGPCKVHLQDKEFSSDICQRFEELCEEYGQAFSKHNEDIGRTKLVKMDVDSQSVPPPKDEYLEEAQPRKMLVIEDDSSLLAPSSINEPELKETFILRRHPTCKFKTLHLTSKTL